MSRAPAITPGEGNPPTLPGLCHMRRTGVGRASTFGWCA